jgi:hypothetical protein
MSAGSDEPDLGPIDSRTWPKELIANAVTVGPHPRLFGYDVEGDLAAHYRFSDLIYVSLTGELPDDARSRAFEVALCFAAPLSVREAPVHAAVLARLCGARPGGVLSVAGLTLAEHAGTFVALVNDVLETRSGELPPELQAQDEDERAAVASLVRLLDGVFDVPVLRADPSREVAIIAVLRACGLTSTFQLTSVLTLARLPGTLAEASKIKPGDFGTYPIDTPHFEYVAPANAPQTAPESTKR